MRIMTARLIAPILRLTGFRFSKHYRWGTRLHHRIIYRLTSTPLANNAADGCSIDLPS